MRLGVYVKRAFDDASELQFGASWFLSSYKH